MRIKSLNYEGLRHCESPEGGRSNPPVMLKIKDLKMDCFACLTAGLAMTASPIYTQPNEVIAL